MPAVNLEIIGSVVKITLDDPGTLNALNANMTRELREAVRYAAEPEHNFRCLLLTGAGRAFCSGGSLGLIGGTEQQDKQDPIRLGTHHHYVMRLLKNLPYPIVTAINGPAAGLGFSYALTGDLIVAAKSAFFLAAFSNLGVSTDGGLGWTLPKIIGWARAKELLLMGNRLPADTALEWGLINRVFDDASFQADALQLAQDLANGPTQALAAIRQMAWESWDLSYEQLLDYEEKVQRGTFNSSDAREGAMSVIEKRPANFTGN